MTRILEVGRRALRSQLGDRIGYDVRFTLRGLRRSPGFSAAIIVTLALGVGANAAVFSFLDRLFVRAPAGVNRPAQVRRLFLNLRGSPFAKNGEYRVPSFNYPEIASLYSVIDSSKLGLVTVNDSGNVGPHGSTIPARYAYATPSFFAVLGVRAAAGRLLRPDEGRVDGAPPVAVISQAFWRRAFGGDSSVLDRPIQIDGKAYAVVGVAALDFTGIEMDATDIWLPLGRFDPGSSMHGRPWYQEEGNFLHVVTRVNSPAGAQRLEAGGSVAVRRALTGMSGRPDSTTVLETGPTLAAWTRAYAQPEIDIGTRIGGVALIVLLIACANVANLLLLRAMRRQREIAIRLALGISRVRLAAQLITESVILSLVAGCAAVLIAEWGGSALRHLLMPSTHWAGAAVDTRVLVFSLIAAGATGVIAGLAPAFQATRPVLVHTLKSSAREGTYHRSRLRSALLIAQAALSLVLLVGAALFVRSLDKVESLPLGYDTDRLVFASLSSGSEYGNQPDFTAPLAEAATRLASVPGVQEVVPDFMAPMRGFTMARLFLLGHDSVPILPRAGPTFLPVAPGFFRTTGLRIISGREFDAGDRTGAAPVAVVNESMAKHLWPNESPLGQCLRLDRRDAPCTTIVGVSGDAHRGQIIEEPTLQFYIPLAQRAGFTPQGLIVRAAPGQAAAVEADTRRLLTQIVDSSMHVRVMTMADALAPQLRSWRMGAILFTAFGFLALVVAAVGIYSVVAYTFVQRTHEVGVRIALGAQTIDVMRLVVRDGVTIVAVGIGLGILIAIALARLVASLLYGISAHDPVTLACSAAALLLIGIAASVLPALRASRVDPVEALRAE